MPITQEKTEYSLVLDQIISSIKLPDNIVNKKMEALSHFEELQFPSMKNEEWKYTYLRKFLKKGFAPEFISYDNVEDEKIRENLPLEADDVNRIVLVDGIFSPGLSNIQASINYNISSLSKSWEKNITLVTDSFAQLTKEKNQALTKLNTALCQDGAFIEVTEGHSLNLEVIYVQTGTKKISMPRLNIHIDSNAYLNIAEQHIVLKEGSFTNIVTEVFLKENSKLEWVKIQDTKYDSHILDSVYVLQNAKSKYHCTTVSLDGELMRNNQFIKAIGEKAHADLGGIYILDGTQQADNNIFMEHIAPNTTSNQLYKGILDGQSTSSFYGLIYVDELAQKTDAFQSNKNILQSDDASANFRPQLEIYADDVKCSHGATSSEIEDHELFYLRSRGISKKQSKALLMYAFVSDVIEEILSESLKAWVRARIESKLKIEL
ncbi:MAG: Fe-S cluster assembly protein SufD [Chitinophagales bacterium]|nr:Fe-S cluster assembly protein SufD [Chitinophagales bacterium]